MKKGASPPFLIDKDKNGKEKRKHLSATKQEAHRSLIKEIKHSCLKTIVAFLNADGGQLVIGVYENKELQINEVIGIEEDAKDQTKEKKEFFSPDEYKRLITSNIENRINYGKKSNGKTVCIVDVKPFFPRIGETLVCLKPEQGNKVRPEDRKEDEIYKRRTNKSEKLNIEEAQYLLQKRTFKN